MRQGSVNQLLCVHKLLAGISFALSLIGAIVFLGIIVWWGRGRGGGHLDAWVLIVMYAAALSGLVASLFNAVMSKKADKQVHPPIIAGVSLGATSLLGILPFIGLLHTWLTIE